MALDLHETYPDQVDPDAAYPQGKARNVDTPGDGTGFPWEKTVVNDWLGFFQAILLLTGITPSEVPDTANVSQYLEGIRYIADRSRNAVSVKEPRFATGAKGDGTTDDTAAIQAAIDYQHAAGGGTVYFPPGTYQRTTLTLSPLVNFAGLPGLVKLRMNHATARSFIFAAAWTKYTEFYGIEIEASTSNTGEVFYEAGTGIFLLRFVHCGINKSAALLAGQLFSSVSASRVDLVDSEVRTVHTSAHHFSVSRVRMTRGVFTMAPGATVSPIGPFGGSVIDGTEFVHVSTVGGVAFVRTNGESVRLLNAKYSVDDSSAGAGTFALRLEGGKARTSNNDFDTVTAYQFDGALAAGSDLQLEPYVEANGTDFDISGNRETAVWSLSSTATDGPAITLPEPLFRGQPLEIILHNNTGGSWAASPTFTAVESVEYQPVTGAASGDILSWRFRAVRISGGALRWVQVGGAYTD